MSETFTWWGAELTYFDHPYNDTRKNERAVEVPIALAWLNDIDPDVKKRGLEVGNVLSHYTSATHDIVDLYERAPHVLNIDVMHYHDQWRYDWIVSISTIEHTSDADGTWWHMADQLLRKGGKMLVTAGLGQDDQLDDAIIRGRLKPTRQCVFVREGDGWVQSDELRRYPYPDPKRGWAQAVWIGEVDGGAT